MRPRAFRPLVLVAVTAIATAALLPLALGQDAAPVPKWAPDAGLSAAPADVTRASAKFPIPDLSNPRGPILTFTTVFATSGTAIARGTVSVQADRIIAIASVHPTDLKPAADGSPSPFAGHVLSSLVYEGGDIAEETLVLGDPGVLTATWAHLLGRRAIRLTTTE